jgi:hypothetical protein
MTGTVLDFAAAAGEHYSEEQGAPPLPVERHIVAAALSAERIRAVAAQLILVLQYAPRDAATVDRLQDEILSAWSAIYDQHGAYRALLECEGQA